MLLEKWLMDSYSFSGEITVPFCMMALGKLLVQKYELLNGMVLEVKEEKCKAASLILQTLVLHISKAKAESSSHKEVPEDFDLYGDVNSLMKQKGTIWQKA